MGASRAIALCQSVNGSLEFQAGHWAEAEAALRESIQLNRQLGTAFGEAVACQRLGALLTAQGRLDEGFNIIEEGLAAAEHGIGRSHALTRLYATMARNRLTADDLAAADQALSQGLSAGHSHGHCGTCELLMLPVAISIRLAQADMAAAEQFCQQLDEATARYNSRTWLALALQARGELAAAQGNTQTALDYYQKAYTGFQAAENRVMAEQSLEAMARLQELS